MIASITAANAKRLKRFVRCFIPHYRQMRWEIILNGSQRKWRKLSMDDLWERVDSSENKKLINIEQFMERNESLADQSAVLIKLSGGGAVETGTVSECLERLVFDDAIVLIYHGDFALACHHTGEWMHCSYE